MNTWDQRRVGIGVSAGSFAGAVVGIFPRGDGQAGGGQGRGGLDRHRGFPPEALNRPR